MEATTIEKIRNEKRAQSVIRQLKRRQFAAFYCETLTDAKELALSLTPPESTVSFGGSITLADSGFIEQLHAGPFHVLDRELTTTPEERLEVMRQALLCDTYFTSLNALSADGQLVNLDGVGNRVAALTFGPQQVIALVSLQKVYADVETAVKIIRQETAPLNANRLGLTTTPCGKNGRCGDCLVPECICSSLVITRFCKVPQRIKIILVNENCGL